MQDPSPQRRTVRSYVRRAGRLTPAQQRALHDLWPMWGIEYHPDRLLDFSAIFGRAAPVVMEIGFGNGETLADDAAADPQTNFLGIEVHTPGIGRLLMELETRDIQNVRIMNHDAVEVLNCQIPSASLDAVHIYFPDPWPKKRHHKRRLIQPPFVLQLEKLVSPGGRLHIATDWRNYAEQIGECLAEAEKFELVSDSRRARSETKFEQRGRKLGHAVWDFVALRRPD